MKYWQPELSTGQMIPVIVPGEDKDKAIIHTTTWLKYLDQETRAYFTGSYTPTISDCIPVQESLCGVIVLP